MAFLKRTWLARLGTGLNKFLIGEKGADGKQTLTNSPDTVVQEGDVISADNLNDLEDRIDTAINANESAINSMKLTKIWENPDPTASFSAQTIDLGEVVEEIVIEYLQQSLSTGTFFQRFKVRYSNPDTHIGFFGTLSSSYVNIPIIGTDTYTCVDSRGFSVYTQGTSFIKFLQCAHTKIYDTPSVTRENYNVNLIPVAIYRVGDNNS